MRKLLARFVEHVKAEHNGDNGDGNRGGGGRSGACAMLRLELAVPENLMRLGKAAMQRLVSELRTGHQGRQMIRNGVRYRLNGYRSKTVHGCMRCSRCCAPTTPVAWGRGWRHWMSGRGSRTGTPSACEYHVAQFVGNNPYQRSRDHFHQIFRPDGVESDLGAQDRADGRFARAAAGGSALGGDRGSVRGRWPLAPKMRSPIRWWCASTLGKRRPTVTSV